LEGSVSTGAVFELERTAQKAKITEFPGFVMIEGVACEPFAMRTATFARYMDRNKGSIDWIFDWPNIAIEDRYWAVTPTYFYDYVEDPAHQLDFTDHLCPLPVAVALGEFHLIVYDGSVDDGYFYDLEGKPVYRSFAMELCTSDFGDLGPLAAHLRKNKKIKNLMIDDTPWYNRESSGAETMTFNYYPEYKEFFELYEIDKEDCTLGVSYALEACLGLARERNE
jgi:hypothetical protein